MISNQIFLINSLKRSFPLGIKSIVIQEDGVFVYIDKDYLINILNFLKLSSLFQFKELLDICGIDYPARFKRFEVLYCLLSVRFGIRLFLKLQLGLNEDVASSVSVFSSAGWLEREVWDMFGVYFKGHNDLRRILTDYGFEGFPLRKDFPLSGYTEVRYDDVTKKIISEPLEVTQEFRYFDFVTPWEKEKE
jgi:NADH/F420H2 dehydrogenase subunit C